MDRATRKRISALKAKITNLLGLGGGFFTQYEFVDKIEQVDEPYREVDLLCGNAPFRDVLAVAKQLSQEIAEMVESGYGLRADSRMLSILDGATTYAIVSKYRPNRVIEIGSGDSTFVLSKAAQSANITCIDPKPRQCIAKLPVEWIPRTLSINDLCLFDQLDRNDILFIDSSHIMLPNFDVDLQFNRIFPRLRPGVIVHVHDIFLPFDYPADWRPRNWNEQNALVGWLFGAFDIIYPGHFVARRYPDVVRAALGEMIPLQAGSMWLQKRDQRH